MKKFVLAAAFAATMLVSSAASAIPVITFTAPAADGSFTGMFGNSGIAGDAMGAFSDTYTFNLPTGLAAWTVSSTFNNIAPTNNIDFTSVQFNGVNFNIGATGDNEYRFLNNQATTGGSQTLSVNGVSGGNGSYAGTLAFSLVPGGGVPEPASWALMLVGFGGVGALLRSNRRRPAMASAA